MGRARVQGNQKALCRVGAEGNDNRIGRLSQTMLTLRGNDFLRFWCIASRLNQHALAVTNARFM